MTTEVMPLSSVEFLLNNQANFSFPLNLFFQWTLVIFNAFLIDIVECFPGGSNGRESARNAGDPGSIPGSGRFPWRREWQPTPAFLPGESHGQRSLGGYSLWGCKERDTTELLTHT